MRGGLILGLALLGYWLAANLGEAAWAMGWLGRTPPRFCTLEQVLDGDSLRLRCDGGSLEVRLHCIDAPERDQRPWGTQSRRHLRQITPQSVELQTVEIDRFGRAVGKLYSTGADRRLLNLEQVAAGQAAVYGRYCTDPAFTRAERAARAARLGIWSRPGEQQTPWVFRHQTER